MAYIARMISNGETVIGVSRLHWIYLVQGLIWLIFMMAVGFMLDALLAMALSAILPSVNWGWAFMGVQVTWLEMFFLMAGLYLFAIYFIKVATTELALTDQRIIYKIGWLFVNVREMNLDEIRGTHIDLGMLGRFLGYGSISFDARFVGDMVTGHINRPYRFIRALNEAQDKMESNISLVIDKVKGGKFNIQQPADREDAPSVHGHEKREPPETKPKMPKKWKKAAKREAEQPVLTPDQMQKALEGKTVTVPMPAVFTQGQDVQQNPPEEAQAALEEGERPQAEAHPVAEGSYEEEKLKEELIEEWTDTAEEGKDPYYRSSRRIH